MALLVFFLPFIVMGNTAGLEIVHPMAVAAVGGILTSTLITLVLLPALYQRFGSGASQASLLDLKPGAVPLPASSQPV
jgi:Cu/Ag efflux pump CusA